MSLPTALVFGDSLAEGLEVPGHQTTIVARPGQTIHRFCHEFPHLSFYLQESRYDVVVFVAGTNNLAHGDNPYAVAQLVSQMGREADRYGAQRIILCTLMHDVFNQALEDLGRFSLCRFLHEDLDTTWLQDDGLHLTHDGQQEFAKEIAKTIRDN